MSLNLQRHEVAALFLQHAASLQVIVHEALHNYTFDVTIDGTSYLACALSRTRHYYDYRLNLAETAITMLVVGSHDSCTSLPALALDEGYFYAPAEYPRWFQPEARRTQRDAMVVVGGLLSGVEDAFTMVEQMKRTTRLGYYAAMRRYLNQKQGRQLIV